MQTWKKILSVALSMAMAVTVFAGTVLTPETSLEAKAYEAGSGVNLNLMGTAGGAAVEYTNDSCYGGNHTIDKAFDGDYSTSWQADDDNTEHNRWLAVEYDGLYAVTSVVYQWIENYPTGTCTIDYSTDGTNWEVATTLPGENTALNTKYTVSFDAVKAKYLRLSITGSSSGNKYAPKVAEFEAYGEPTTEDEEGDEPVLEGALTSKYVKILGKALNETVNGEGGYTFTYGGSGIQVNFVGTELKMYVSGIVDWSSGVGMMVSVDTDMPMEATKMTVSSTGWVTVASGLEDTQHTVTIRKQSRGFGGIVASEWISISDVATDGTLLPADPVSDLVIEVYGDSISNGDATWLNADGSNSAYTAASYSTIVGRLLGADTRVTGNTGNGLMGWVMAGGNNNLMIENLLPPQNSWSVFDPNYKSTAWDHSGDNAADVVIINLGTNDAREFGVDLSRKAFADEYVRFIKQIKTDCPDAIVICTLGAMGAIDTWYPCIAGDGSDYYAYSYTRLTVNDDTVKESTVTGYVEASKKDDFLSTIASHTATATGENGEYLVADVEAIDYDVVVKADSLVIDETASHDDNVLTQCNEWAGEEFVYWTQLATCGSIEGGKGYDNGHPSNIAHEIYGLQIATLINEKLNLGVDLPAISDFEVESNAAKNVNLGTGVTVSGTNNAWGWGKGPAGAIDGDESTFWQGTNATDTQTITIDYGTETTIGAYRIVWGSNEYPADGYKIEYSTDNATWTELVNVASLSSDSAVEGVFTEVSARYVRLSVKGYNQGGNYAAHVNEFCIYDHDPALDTGALFTVSKTVAQRSSDSTANIVRLIAAVDATEFTDNVSTQFWQVGFEVTVADDNHTGTNTRVFSDNLVYDSIGGIDAADLDVNGGKVFALTITDVPENCQLTVRAYAIDENDNTIYGYQNNPTVIRMTGGLMTVRNG